MSCQSFVILENNLTFTITTHDPDTGAVTDADSAPAYRVYEDETSTAILTGTMAKLDDSNTTGFYSEQIACTAANGFEAGKSYNIYIVATVDSDTGAISYGFTVLTNAPISAATIWAYASRTLTQAAASVESAVSGDEVTVYRGTYWEVTLTGLPDLTDRTEVYLAVKESKDDTDNEAIALWSLGTGLERFNGQAATASEGTLTVPSSTSVKVVLKANTAQDAPIKSDLWYGVKRIASGGEAYASSEGGTWNILQDTPRAVT